ncbi:glycosyltransferase family 4 protein [Microbacterium sp. NPDC006705]|uniref:glycosyltransferase family 4 protein n=1 Tax=Microbacterium sp. NPDC006705 TaxID=3364181 RepID=UPI00384D0C9C
MRVLEVLPAVERFDGSGGAVATWVREVATRTASTITVAAPVATPLYAQHISVFTSRSFIAYSTALRAMATAVAPLRGITPAYAYRRLLGSDRSWTRKVKSIAANADILHIHNRPQYAAQVRPANWSGKVLLHMHNDLVEYIDPAKFSWSPVDGIVFCSEFLRQKALRDFQDLPRSWVVHNGVSQNSPRQTSVADGIRVAFAGRLIPEKGAHIAIESVLQAASEGARISLDIYGGTGSGTDNAQTPYSRELIKIAEEDGRNRVRFHGPVPYSTLQNALTRAHIFLYPAQWEEPFGMVALEAMAAGAIPVVPRSGALPHVIAEAGIVVDAKIGDARPYIRALRHLQEQETISRLSDLAVRRSSQFGWHRVASQLDAVLRAL